MTSPPPDAGVYISPAQTLEEVRRIADGQIRMEGKLDRIIDDRVEDRQAVADHEQRIRSLEVRVWMAVGAAVVLGTGGGALAQMLAR
ncbi:hypothetical protein ACIQOW_03770 [Kitasatospora sp. NPDC091335]|uniref:hypothetical protein n=1 Tax=Kitasatospora sp. NPDC091335 TaxID=3364085 RepID=UPI0037FC1C79